jgi:ArsR family transcriptional regulator
MDFDAQIANIKADFISSHKILLAIGNETRQLIFITLLGAPCAGMRVGDIQAKTHLSRPAVSHHIKVLLDCGLAGCSKEGTKNFYYLNTGGTFETLHSLTGRIMQFNEAVAAIGMERKAGR